MNPPQQLDSYLDQLRLSAIAQHYRPLAEEAARSNLSYEAFLTLLLEHELASREARRTRQAIKQAHFPVLKELADFDFGAVPKLNRARVLALAEGAYIAKAESVILVGNPGLGKTHIATGLALAACW